MKYLKRPVLVDAVRWTGGRDSWRAVCEFVGVPTDGVGDNAFVWMSVDSRTLLVRTPEGEARCPEGDWIIRGPGEDYAPCRADEFDATYDPVEGTL